MVPLVDTHAHVCDDALWADRAAVLSQARECGVAAVLCVGFDLRSSERSLLLCAETGSVRAAVGIHPTSLGACATSLSKPTDSPDFVRIANLSRQLNTACIGETGLDFYWDPSTEAEQREAFAWHLDLAVSLGLPVTVHSRSAEEAVVDMLNVHAPPGAALHCFGGSQETARRALAHGWYIGVGGPVTFKKSAELQELVKWLPEDRLLLETDSPYLSPAPLRGKRNEPSRVKLVAEMVAKLRGVDREQIAEVTTRNAMALFPRLAPALQ